MNCYSFTDASYYNGTSLGYESNQFDTITKIFLFGTDVSAMFERYGVETDE